MIKYILTVFIILTLVFSGLSYKFYGDKKEAEASLILAIDANTALQKSLNLQVESCKINEQVVTEFQTEKQAKDLGTNSVLSSLDKIPAITKSVPKSAQPQGAANENNVVNIDDKLPNDVISLLQSHCNTNKGSTCVNP